MPGKEALEAVKVSGLQAMLDEDLYGQVLAQAHFLKPLDDLKAGDEFVLPVIVVVFRHGFLPHRFQGSG